MSAIKKIGTNSLRRDVVSSDRTTVYTDGYENLFTATTPVTIADIVAGYVLPGSVAGQVELSNIYVPGTANLMININGLDLLEPGVDYTEITNRVFQLSPFQLGILAAAPLTSKLRIKWNRPLPGSRDQLLNNLKDVTPDISGAVLDDDGGGPFRAAPATPTNPLVTAADVAAGPGALLALAVGTLAAPAVIAIPVGTKRIEIHTRTDVVAALSGVSSGVVFVDIPGDQVSTLLAHGLDTVSAILIAPIVASLPIPLNIHSGGTTVTMSAFTAPTGVPGSLTITSTPGSAIAGYSLWMSA